MYSSLRLKSLKCELLKTLNSKPVEEITDNEAQLTFYLSQDPDVQEALSRARDYDGKEL